MCLAYQSGMLTNAGALLADESPIYCSRLFCTRWNGIDKASGVIDALDDEEYTGSLILLLEEGMSFARRNSKKMWRKESDRRVEYPEYPERSIFEGLVNGLVHRDYLDMGSEVHIDIFDDRLEIYSPGGMYDGTQKIGKRGQNSSCGWKTGWLLENFVNSGKRVILRMAQKKFEL
jgi:ATP-dependent DNA helicase RecG